MKKSNVQAVIFDLDDTLVSTGSLARFRESNDKEGIHDEIHKSHVFNPVEDMLREIKHRGVGLALVSNSPSWYVEELLDFHDLQFFDVKITYDDVGPSGIKPSPKGILLALEHLGLPSPCNAIYIGDKDIDFEAAYYANVKPVAPSWATTHPINQVPAAILNSEHLISYLDDYDKISLIADRTALKRTFEFDKDQLNFIPLNERGQVTALDRSKIRLIALGRYFSQGSTLTANYHEAHQLSKDIFAKELSETYVIPQYYVSLMSKVIESLPLYVFNDDHIAFDIITVIPSKKGKNTRLENFLKRIEKTLNSSSEFITDLFEFHDGAKSLKTLGGYEKRIDELKQNLTIRQKYLNALGGKSILVIDDVLTTGASFGRAFELLDTHNASFSMGVCLAKTVSVEEKLGLCPDCNRILRINTNKNTGIHFIGCTGFFETPQCKYHKSIKLGTCPECGENLVKRYNRADKNYFLGCEGYARNRCKYTKECDEI